MADVWKVTQSLMGRPARTLFQGLEKDARRFVENNFPRAHVEPPSQEPGIPDVQLVSPSGAEETYHAEDGWSGQAESAPEEVKSAGSDLA